MNRPTVLIVGAGVAGPALAFWLARSGFRPTVIERAADLRTSGNPIDVKGPAVRVAERMGVMSRLRDLATRVTAATVLDPAGRPVARLDMTPKPGGNVELARSDLASTLYDASRDDVEYLFGDAVAGLHQDDSGVDVTFSDGAPRRFSLVIGTDGLHSTVRRLVFGPEERFARHMGMYVATVPLSGQAIERPNDLVLHSNPGRLLLIHPGRDKPVALFIFGHEPVDRHDVALRAALVAEAFGETSWRAPEMVDVYRRHPSPFFDSVERVRMPSWSRGRVALLGDAASSVALFGDGSTLAVAGAYTLARALAAHPGDHARAFRAFESRHRCLTEPRQRSIPLLAPLMIPRSPTGLAARNRLVGVLGRVAGRPRAE